MLDDDTLDDLLCDEPITRLEEFCMWVFGFAIVGIIGALTYWRWFA